MPNQMIALQARAPALPDPGAVTARSMQMANMMMQQRALERQNALAAQKMDLEAQLAGPQIAKAKSDAFAAEQEAFTKFFDVAAKVIGVSKSPEDVLFGADMLKKQYDNPIFAQIIDQTIKDMPTDPQAFGAWRNQTKLETMDAKDQVPYYFEQLKSKEIIGESGDVGVLTTGGLNAPTIKIPRTMIPDNRKGTVSVEPSVTIDENAPVSAEDAEAFIQSFPREAQAAIRQRVNQGALGNIPMGSPVSGGLVTGERGGVGGPDEGYVEAATPFRAKNPSVAPYPGSAQVAPSVLGAQKGAEAKATKAVEREERLIADLPKAHAQASSLISNLTDRINRIDQFLRNPYRNTIIGSIEGRIPEALMNERRADAIADWNFIKNNSVLDKLIQDRQNTETGASPQGMVSDRDLSVAASSSNTLTRTGSEPKQEQELLRMRDVLYRTLQGAIRTYNNTYGDLIKRDPQFRLTPRPVSPKYTGPLKKGAAPARGGRTLNYNPATGELE